MTLNAPTKLIFLLSLIIAIIAVITALNILPFIPIAPVWIMTVSFVLLAAGCILKGV